MEDLEVKWQSVGPLFQELVATVSDGPEICLYMTQFLKNLASVEEDYYFSVSELCSSAEAHFVKFVKEEENLPAKTIEMGDIGSLSKAWNTFRTELENMALPHSQIAEILDSEITGPLLEVTEKESENRSKIEEGQKLLENFRNAKEELKKNSNYFEKKKDLEIKLDFTRKEGAKALKEGLPKQRVVELKNEYSKRHKELQDLETSHQPILIKVKALIKDIEKKVLPDIIRKLEAYELNRIKTVFNSFTRILDFEQTMVQPIHDGYSKIAESVAEIDLTNIEDLMYTKRFNKKLEHQLKQPKPKKRTKMEITSTNNNNTSTNNTITNSQKKTSDDDSSDESESSSDSENKKKYKQQTKKDSSTSSTTSSDVSSTEELIREREKENELEKVKDEKYQLQQQLQEMQLKLEDKLMKEKIENEILSKQKDSQEKKIKRSN